MSDGPDGRRRWPWAIALGVAAFVFTRVRAEIPPYVALHRLAAELDVPRSLRNLDGSLLLLLAAWLGARIVHGGGAAAALGLSRATGDDERRGSRRGVPFSRGVWFGVLAGLPMVLQAAFAGGAPRLDVDVVKGSLLAPFVEEVFFRGLLVAVAVRYGAAPFWPTAILAGLLFGAAHVPWNAGLGAEHVPTLLVTAAGGIWYAWIVRAHDWCLWTTIALHAVMNGAWMVFGIDGAVGSGAANVGRTLTIVLGTAMTLRRSRRGAAHDAPAS